MSVRWTDLVDPTAEELLAAAPQLDPGGIEALTAAAGDGRDARPLLDSRGGAVIGLLVIPAHVHAEHRFSYLEVVIVATTDTVVTARKSDEDGRIVEQDALAPPASGHASAGAFVHTMIDGVAERYLDLVDVLYAEIDELEDHIDELPGATIRRRLAELRHEMLNARKNVTATRAAVRRVIDGRLETPGEPLFPRDVEMAFADTYDTLVRTTEELDVARDLLASVRDYLQSKMAESQNEVVKKLTVVASLVLVPTLITGFYGQNFAGAFDGALWSVGVSLGLIVGTTLAQLAFFRWKRWI